MSELTQRLSNPSTAIAFMVSVMLSCVYCCTHESAEEAEFGPHGTAASTELEELPP